MSVQEEDYKLVIGISSEVEAESEDEQSNYEIQNEPLRQSTRQRSNLKVI